MGQREQHSTTVNGCYNSKEHRQVKLSIIASLRPGLISYSELLGAQNRTTVATSSPGKTFGARVVKEINNSLRFFTFSKDCKIHKVFSLRAVKAGSSFLHFITLQLHLKRRNSFLPVLWFTTAAMVGPRLIWLMRDWAVRSSVNGARWSGTIDSWLIRKWTAPSLTVSISLKSHTPPAAPFTTRLNSME